tara:strand:- start:243 stop:1154 length:912 start_codon:yes stop_codon:yes gene_type:complete
MMIVLITGVAGFIGSKLAQKFLDNNHVVYGVDDLSSGLMSNVPKGLKFIEFDLSIPEVIEILPQSCDLILHLAGQSSGEISFDNPINDLNKNTVSTLNLIEYGRRCKIKKFLYASSMSVYGNVPDKPISESFIQKPLSCYGVGKLASEHYLEIFKREVPYINFRMFNVYGPGQDLGNLRQGMISIFLAMALKTGEIHIKGSLNRFRDFIYIDDVVDIWHKLALEENLINLTLNLGTGVKTTIKVLMEEYEKNIPNISYYNEGITLGDQNGIYADNTLLRKTLKNVNFIPLSKGLKDYIKKVYQ